MPAGHVVRGKSGSRAAAAAAAEEKPRSNCAKLYSATLVPSRGDWLRPSPPVGTAGCARPPGTVPRAGPQQPSLPREGHTACPSPHPPYPLGNRSAAWSPVTLVGGGVIPRGCPRVCVPPGWGVRGQDGGQGINLLSPARISGATSSSSAEIAVPCPQFQLVFLPNCFLKTRLLLSVAIFFFSWLVGWVLSVFVCSALQWGF